MNENVAFRLVPGTRVLQAEKAEVGSTVASYAEHLVKVAQLTRLAIVGEFNDTNMPVFPADSVELAIKNWMRLRDTAGK